MKKLLLAIAAIVAMTSAGHTAGLCIKIDEDNSPAAMVSGRVATYHATPRESDGEGRTADGPFLKLDEPLMADTGAGCQKFSVIVIITDKKLRANQRMTIRGKLARFGSSLVYPSVFIEADH